MDEGDFCIVIFNVFNYFNLLFGGDMNLYGDNCGVNNLVEFEI